HLTTTDPAAHLDQVVSSELSSLKVSRIDPAVEARRYREQTMASKGANLDAPQRALLEEELRSPCYDEVAIFLALTFGSIQRGKGEIAMLSRSVLEIYIEFSAGVEVPRPIITIRAN
ncbi:MAG: hypothetical protein ACXWVP_07270, partial [Burkholderiales bacterium]